MNNPYTNINSKWNCGTILFDKDYQYNIITHFRYSIVDILEHMIVNYKKKIKNGDVYYGYIDNCYTIIDKSKSYEKYQKLLRFSCPITKDNIKYYKGNCDGHKLKDIINNVKIYNRYLDSIDGKILYIDDADNKYIIAPVYGRYVILKENIEKIKKYKITNSITKLYNELQIFSFNYYITDSSIKSIYDINLKKIKIIKKRIMNFCKSLCGENFNEYSLVATIIQHENECVYIEFGIKIAKYDWKYVNYFSNYIPDIDLNRYIELLESGNEHITIYKTFYLDVKNDNNTNIDKFCRNNEHTYDSFINSNLYKIKHHLTSFKYNIKLYDNNDRIVLYKSYTDEEKLVITFNNIKGGTIDDKYKSMKIISYYYKIDRVQPRRCENVILLMDNNNNYYICKIYNLCYNLLKNSNTFRNLFYDKYINGDGPRFVYNKGYKDEKEVYIGKMPSYFGIRIEKLNNIDIFIDKINVVETRKLYKKYVLKTIKNGTLDSFIFITLTILNTCRKHIVDLKYYESCYELLKKTNNSKLLELISMNRFLMEMVNSEIMFNGSFFISKKISYDTSYILWYLPLFIAGNLNDIIDNINKLLDNNDNNESYIRKINRDNNIIQLMKDYKTNYLELYNDKKFKHNIRHLSKEDNNDISLLLHTFLKYKYDKEFNIKIDDDINIKSKVNNAFYGMYNKKYYIYCHYPNALNYGIFHIQIINATETPKLSNPDVLGNYMSVSHKRIFFWNHIKNTLMKSKDIYMNFELIYKDIINQNSIYKNIKYGNNDIDIRIKNYNI